MQKRKFQKERGKREGGKNNICDEVFENNAVFFFFFFFLIHGVLQIQIYRFVLFPNFFRGHAHCRSGTKTLEQLSLYPKEGNPLWEELSSQAVASTLKSYSSHTFDYPYHKAISVHAKNQGMEYPMICWNYGRPNEDGTYSDRIKYGMISVIFHDVGHSNFPMIVNSDERQWKRMDERLDIRYAIFGRTRIWGDLSASNSSK